MKILQSFCNQHYHGFSGALVQTEQLQLGRKVGIYLPISGIDCILAGILDESGNIFRRIAEEQSKFVRETFVL